MTSTNGRDVEVTVTATTMPHNHAPSAFCLPQTCPGAAFEAGRRSATPPPRRIDYAELDDDSDDEPAPRGRAS